MEYAEAEFLTADKREEGIKINLENIKKNPVLLFPKYSSLAHQTFMEIHDKNLIRDFHYNKKEIENYIEIQKQKNEAFHKMSFFSKFLNYCGIIRIKTSYEKEINNLKEENIRIAEEYKKIISKILKEDEKITLKTHALHYYMTGIPALDKKTQETCDDMFSKGQFLTSNIADTEGNIYLLFFHNWIMVPIIESYKQREAINQEIQKN